MFVDLQKSGLTFTDIIGIEAILILNSIIQPIFMILFAGKSEMLTELSHRLLELNRLLDVTEIETQVICQRLWPVLSGILVLG